MWRVNRENVRVVFMLSKPVGLTAYCPDCDSEVYFSKRPSLGQVVVCRECNAHLEVVETDPIELEWALDVEEELEEEFEYEYDDNDDDDF